MIPSQVTIEVRSLFTVHCYGDIAGKSKLAPPVQCFMGSYHALVLPKGITKVWHHSNIVLLQCVDVLCWMGG